jgi:hypothetical protein
MAELTTQNGFTVTLDDQDIELFAKYRWFAYAPESRENRTIRRLYVMTHIYLGVENGRSHSKTVYLHRLIAGAQPGETVDHINMDALDNRRANLRIASRSQQNMNRDLSVRNTSGKKGVHFYSRYGTWQAYINVPGKGRIHLGYFQTRDEAAKAYDKAALEHFGEFARVNTSA